MTKTHKYAVLLFTALAIAPLPAHAGITDLFTIITTAGDKFVATQLSIFAAAAAVFLAVVFAGNCVLADFSIYLGLGVGPFLLVLSTLRKFSELSGAWLKFMLAASMYKVFSAGSLVLMEGFFSSTAESVSKAIGSDPGFNFPRIGALVGLLVLAMIGIFVASKIGGLAQSIVSGSGGGLDTGAVAAARPRTSSAPTKGDK